MSVTFIEMGMPWQTPLFLHCSVTLFCVGLITFQKKLNISFKKPVPTDLRKCSNIVTWWNPVLSPFFILWGDDVVWEVLKHCWWPDAASSNQKTALPCVPCHCHMVDHWMDHHCRQLLAMPLLPHRLPSDSSNLEVKSNIWAIKPLFLVASQFIAAHCPMMGSYFLHTEASWQCSQFLRPWNISKWLCLRAALLKSSETTWRDQFCLYTYSVTGQTLKW